MPTEALILRRTFPVPVTFADLRRAHWEMFHKAHHGAHDAAEYKRIAWHAAIKESTGALDEVYAVIDGREVRVATATPSAVSEQTGPRHIAKALADLLIAADEAGYWQRPHEVRHVLEESQMSTRTMARIAANSFIIAGSK